MAEPSLGIINAPKPKPAHPKASPKSFKWPFHKEATDAQRQAFAATLQELLPAKDWTHANLSATLWGTDKYTSRNIAKSRAWVRAEKPFPTETEAAYIADVLGVSMARLLEPTKKFDADTSLVRPQRKQKGKAQAEPGLRKPRAIAKLNGKANGHDTDPRWILPPGIELPSFKVETLKEHIGLLSFELHGVLPSDVAMAVMSMIKQTMATAQRAE